MNRWIKHVLWTVGFIVLLDAVSHIETVSRQQAILNFTEVKTLWVYSICNIAVGTYISLVFISGRRFVNMPMLLFVSLPCLLLSFWYPVSMQNTLRVLQIQEPTWLMKGGYLFFQVGVGISVVMALFNGTATRESQGEMQ